MDEQWWKEDIRGAWKERGEGSRALIQHQAGREREPEWETEKEGRERGGKQKKDSLSAVFCQGRNYTFTEVFSSNDGFHRSNHWIYEPIFNMKYRQWESILPMFTRLLTLFFSLSQSNGLQRADRFTPVTLAALIRAANEDVMTVVIMQPSVDVAECFHLWQQGKEGFWSWRGSRLEQRWFKYKVLFFLFLASE